jgi:hypothetical protein
MDLLNKKRVHQTCLVDPRFSTCLKTVKSYCFRKYTLQWFRLDDATFCGYQEIELEVESTIFVH